MARPLTRREKERRRKLREQAREWRSFPFDLTPYVKQLPEGLPQAIVYARTSSKNGKRQKLNHQTAGLTIQLAEKGCVVARTLAGQEKGSLLTEQDRHTLAQARDLAKQLGLPVVAITLSRFVRSPNFHPITSPHALPGEAELQALTEFMQGVELFALASPDLTAQEDEEELLRNAFLGGATGAEEGVKERCFTFVVYLRHRWRLSTRAIAREALRKTGAKVSAMTVSRWLKEGRGL